MVGGGKKSSSSRASGSKQSRHISNASDPSIPTIPFIRHQDNSKLLPKYSIALSRPHDEYFPAEDLDSIQLELETLLASVALRSRSLVQTLKNDNESSESKDERRIITTTSSGVASGSGLLDRKHKYLDIHHPPQISPSPSTITTTVTPTTTSKRKRVDEKKSKDIGATVTAASTSSHKYFGNQPKVARYKNLSTARSPATSLHTDDSLDTHHSAVNQKIVLPRNDIPNPNKFWLSVDCYCMPITQEDIKLLKDLIDEYSGPLVPPIPDLGPHYSTQWANADIKEEQDNANPARYNKRFNPTTTITDDVTNVMKNGEKLSENYRTITGPITQRFMSAFLEENIINDNKMAVDDETSNNSNKNNTATNQNVNRNLMKNGVEIENRLKKELVEQGILDESDLTKTDDEDEILTEINRVRRELAAIAEYNLNDLKRLHESAKEEIERIEVKRKLDIVDQQIIEMYDKVVSAKQKRRPLTEQETAEIYRLNDEQNRLSNLLETMSPPNTDNVDINTY